MKIPDDRTVSYIRTTVDNALNQKAENTDPKAKHITSHEELGIFFKNSPVATAAAVMQVTYMAVVFIVATVTAGKTRGRRSNSITNTETSNSELSNCKLTELLEEKLRVTKK